MASSRRRDFRWGLVVLIAVLIVGRYRDWGRELGEASKYGSQRAALQQNQAELQKELDQFADPAYRESYWKWRNMRHKPGECYIRFYDGEGCRRTGRTIPAIGLRHLTGGP